ncbi:MAG: hypothetical protein M1482_17620 [Chloroflexi bacterium]|nr:hypothetical protein [Chloroflexota bacterium]
MDQQTNSAITSAGRPDPRGAIASAAADDPELWLRLIESTRDPEDALDYAQRAVGVAGDSRVHESLQRIMAERLARDPFVAFLAETDDCYIISFRDSRPLRVPKARAAPEVFPRRKRTRGEQVLETVRWVALGLVPAGLGALIMGPLVAWRAFQVLGERSGDGRERRLAWLALVLAAALGFVGEVVVMLFLIHWAG